MSDSEFIDDGAIGFHLSAAEMQSVVSRQLVAAAAVAIVTVLVFGLSFLLTPDRHEAAELVSVAAASEQPKVSVPAEHVAAAMQFGIEVP
jgi:hypothetical protein